MLDNLTLKRNCKYISSAVGGIVVIAAAYAVCFPYFIPENSPIEKSDLIVVFPGGGPGRKQAAYQLIKQGYADRIAITSGNEKSVKRYTERHGLAGILKRVSIGKARSTFEDALFTGDLAAKQRFKSVILVTGVYHLPRASFLLRSILADQGVTIYTYGISFEKERAGRNKGRLTQGKMLFDERIKFLGSLVEMGIYRATGVLINDYGWVRAMKNAVKEVVLFQKTGVGKR